MKHCTEEEFIKTTPKGGFKTIERPEMLLGLIRHLIESDMNYFSSMISKRNLGELIAEADRESTDIAKAEKFLNLINNI